LVPSGLSLNVTHDRIAAIYDELRSLPLEKYLNATAVMFRVFLEMSVDIHMSDNNLPRKHLKEGKMKSLNLKQQIGSVIDHLPLDQNDHETRKKLQGIKTQIGTKNTIFSIQNWHGYVHNPHYNPSPTDLIAMWDNTQFFFEKLWA